MSNETHYMPDLEGFEKLFATGESGFSAGSTILVSGPPGAGKTIFALGVIRDLMKKMKQCKPPHRLYYISTETDEDALTNTYAPFHWFSKCDYVLTKDKCTIPIIDEIRMDQPLRGSDELVNLVFSKIKEFEQTQTNERVFVVVDSLTAILKDSKDQGERRRRTHELIVRLSRAFSAGKALALALLISEQPATDEGEVPAEDVVADFVFRLGLSDTGGGRRLRTLEVRKSHGAKTTIGRHTWAIVTYDKLGDVIAQRELAEHIRKKMQKGENADLQTPNKNIPATIVVFPRPQAGEIGAENTFLPPRSRTYPQKTTTDGIRSGIPGLDEMLRNDTAYFAGNDQHRPYGQKNGLDPGSTTLLLGRSGTGKTLMCLQFLLEAEDPTMALYVNFENPPWKVRDDFPGEQKHELFLCKSLYRRRGNLDSNAFLYELRHVLRHLLPKPSETNKHLRVAIDGLSDLLATVDKPAYSQLIETVLATIRHTGGAKRRITTFMTLEMDPSDELFPVTEGLSVTADNIIVLRQVPIKDELRKTAFVLKARIRDHDKQVREIRIADRPYAPLRIRSGLETYSDLLTKNPTPVTVVLQLFAENEHEVRYNAELTNDLTKLFGHPVRAFGFSRSEVSRTLKDAAAEIGRIPPSDVKILSIDEWWIQEYRLKKDDHQTSQRDFQQPLLTLDPFVMNPVPRSHDLLSRVETFAMARNSHAEVLELWEQYTAQKERFQNAIQEHSARVGTTEQLVLCDTIKEDMVNLRELAGSLQAVCEMLSERIKQLTASNGRLPKVNEDEKDHEAYKNYCKASTAIPTDINRIKPDLDATHAVNWEFKMLTQQFLQTTPTEDLLDQYPQELKQLTQSPAKQNTKYDLSSLRKAQYYLHIIAKELASSAHPEHVHFKDSDFWIFELEKASSGENLLALPNYMDFGLFAVNTMVATQCDLPWSCLKRNDSQWEDLLNETPRVWAELQDGWFSCNANDTIVGFLHAHRESIRRRDNVGFAFDMEIMESAVCTFFELAWAFGAREGLLKWAFPSTTNPGTSDENEKKQQDNDINAMETAIRLLQFLVVQKMMPPHPTLDDTRRAVFSRHWYSTLSHDTPGGASTLPFVVLPFFPVGQETKAFDTAMVDMEMRLDRILRRIEATCNKRGIDSHMFSESRGYSERLKNNNSEKKISEAWKIAKEIEDWLLGSSQFKPRCATSPKTGKLKRPIAGTRLDERDVFELLRWHRFRLTLLNDALRQRNNGKANKGIPQSCLAQSKTSLTGYACSGSWLVGVHRSTHSPALAWKFLEEMTSLHRAAERAEKGAGIPPRKDFYEHHGDKKVKFAEHLTWNELLLYAGSRYRRRDRALGENVPPQRVSEIFEVIYAELRRALGVARLKRNVCWKGDSFQTKEWKDVRDSLAADAKRCVETIVETCKR